MTNQPDLKSLYQLIKSGEIRPEDAAQHFKRLVVEHTIQSSSANSTKGIAQGEMPGINTSTDAIKATLRETIALLLKVGTNDVDDMILYDQGLDAIQRVELARVLQREYGFELHPAVLAESIDLQSLATSLAEEHAHLIPKTEIAPPETLASELEEVVPADRNPWLRDKAETYIKRLLSPVIKLSADRIEADAPLERYGIDSVMAVQLTSQLESAFGPLPKTLFFEYQSIRELTDHLLSSYQQSFMNVLRISADSKPGAVPGSGHISAVADSKIRVSAAAVPAPSVRPEADTRSSGESNHADSGALDIAIIGLAGRYPGANDIQEYWQNLQQGRDCVTEIPPERWDSSVHMGSKWGGFLEGADQFDPLFFQIAPRDAETMDPQERLFLQCAYETMEDAGYTRESFQVSAEEGLGGNVGVFVGVMYQEYQLYGAQEQVRGRSVALSGNSASIANRVSYFMNLHGPSMAVDTMCSSSLTAIHLACQSIRNRGCELAIAGGVNLSIHPNKYLALEHGRFASSKGRCESFGEGGDGYVPGEGVGAVLLKPLAKAVADGDHIYGIIKGISINHGGRTNGYTVPNVKAQAAVVVRAMKEAGVDPRQISYIEAHGTGTSLGDPIEISGLTKAFQASTRDTQYCAIGSVKSNIGHAESAAGIAGLTKILLQMKHGQLVPSLHSQVLNPHIDFSHTPFVVQQQLETWRRPLISSGESAAECPRIAGLSSFGAGGSNAHIVVEEYIPCHLTKRKKSPITAQNPALVVLSAKNRQQLQQQAERLRSALSDGKFSDGDLPDVAYTLQIGREALEERLAMTALSIRELEDKLSRFLDGHEDVEDVYHRHVQAYKEIFSFFGDDEELKEAMEKWIQRRKYGKLLDLWSKGITLDWSLLYGPDRPCRVSLPTYPFAKERYWVPEGAARGPATTEGLLEALHPLVQKNISTFEEMCYTSTFTGQEFFLKDHVVQGQSVMPGVVHLEMARVAVMAALHGQLTDRDPGGIRLSNVQWIRPLTVEQPVQIHIRLTPEEEDIFFDIFSGQEEHGGKHTGYSSGRAAVLPLVPAPHLNLLSIREACSLTRYSSDAVYETFRSMGIDYGPGHRAIQDLYVGSGQVLARIEHPEVLDKTAASYLLHPGLMDASLQSMLGLDLGASPASLRLFLPHALEELDLFGACEASMWAWVRYQNKTDTDLQDRQEKRIDIDVCDPEGKVLVQMRGISCVERAGVRSQAGRDETAALKLQAEWQEQPIARQAIAADDLDRWVILCDPKADWTQQIERWMTGVHCAVLQAPRSGVTEKYESCALQLFEYIQALLRKRPEGRVFIQLVVPMHVESPESQLCTALGALLKTAQAENPRIVGQVIEVEGNTDATALADLLNENSRLPAEQWVRYVGSRRFVRFWKEASERGVERSIPWKSQGVYLITGGIGGLGLIFAKDIAQKTRNSVLILTGRSPLNEEKRIKLQEIEAYGARVVYRQVDVTNPAAVEELTLESVRQFDRIDGIIHSAGVTNDSYIIQKSAEDFAKVLAPKVAGLVNMDEASRSIDLDFFMMFSSIAGVVGNPGQADYAAANAFMDAYAVYRSSLTAQGKRRGRTLSINWPLWQEGGMHVGSELETMMAKHTGMTALKIPDGLQACYQSLASDGTQMLVLHGDREKLRHFIGGFKSHPEEPLGEEYFVRLTEKVSSGEITEEQFREIILMK